MAVGRRLLEGLLVSTFVGVSVVVLLIVAGTLGGRGHGDGVAMAKSANAVGGLADSAKNSGDRCDQGHGDDCGNGRFSGEHEGDSGDHDNGNKGNGNGGNGNGGKGDGEGSEGNGNGDHDDGDDEDNGEGEGPPVKAGECPAPGFMIDFAGLPAGTMVDEQYASRGVHIAGIANRDFPNAVVLFDSNAPPTHDPDLHVNLGNIALLPLNLTDSNHDGLVDDPDENNFGGKQIYAFDQPVHIGSFLFIDKDHGTPDKAIAFDPSGNVITTALIPVAGNGSVQKIEVNASNVLLLVIDYHESGALTGIEVNCQPGASGSPTPTPTPSPAGASATPTAAATGSPGPCPPDGFVIDFAGFLPGTIMTEQYASRGVHIAGVGLQGFPDAVVLYDSDATPPPDLGLFVHLGNIALLPQNLTDTNHDGLVDQPRESNFGGKQIYTFDQPVHIGSFLMIDKNHGTPDHAFAYDAGGNLITTALIPVGAAGSVQKIEVNADNVSKLVIDYRDSAALTRIEVNCVPGPSGSASATPTATPTPSGQASTPTPTPTATPSEETPTPTATGTPSAETATPTATATPSETATPTGPAETPTPGEETGTPTATPTGTPAEETATPTATATETPTAETGTPTETASPTATPGPGETETPGPTESPSEETATPTATATASPTATATASPTATATATATATPAGEQSPTGTPGVLSASATPAVVATVSPGQRVAVTQTPAALAALLPPTGGGNTKTAVMMLFVLGGALFCAGWITLKVAMRR